MKSLIKKVIISILTWEAKQVIKKYKPRIIAVTGSVGKTSTKDAIFSALSPEVDIRKNKKSFNSEIGTPLTILNCPTGWNNLFIWLKNIINGLLLILIKQPYPAWLVLEIGADRPGDIANVAKWLPCDVVVITRIPDVPVHVEYFPSVEAVSKEKRALVKALKPEGTLVLNADDKNVMVAKEGVSQNVITYGFTSDADIQATDIEIAYTDLHGQIPSGMQTNVVVKNELYKVQIKGALGNHLVYPALAAIAVAKSQKINIKKVIAHLEDHVPPPGRMRIVDGYHESTIIDDTYNASPVAMAEAITTLNSINTSGKKIAVLGDMMEIGDFSVKEHKRMGEMVAKKSDFLISVGVRAQDIQESAVEHGFTEEQAVHFRDSISAGNWLKNIIHPGDVILVKGSQSMRMEKVVEAIMANPAQKEKLLVRQEKEWKNR